METAARFWTFGQNNSGGVFDYQPNDGVTHYVIVEANGMTHAMSRAIDIGLYFNGCDSGMDCSCCGDRWSEPWDEEGNEAPEVYGKPAEEYGNERPIFAGMYSLFEKGEVCIHYLDGRKVWHLPHPKATP